MNYKVCVRCCTYNQSNFICDALSGFAIQDTDFPYVCCVIDDASTDGEQRVIEKYIDENCFSPESTLYFRKETDTATTIFTRHLINNNCYFVFVLLKTNLYHNSSLKLSLISEWRNASLYDAVCEGDDYWIDSHKLQKQVGFLDSHEDCQLIFHNSIVRNDNSINKDSFISNFETGYFKTVDIYKIWQISLASLVYRKDLYNSVDYCNMAKVWDGGFAIMLAASRIGSVYGISEAYSVYRKNVGGISNEFSDAYCLDLNLGLALTSGSRETYSFAIRQSYKKLARLLPKLFFKNNYALEHLNVIKKYDKYALYKAIFISIYTLPIVVLEKLFKANIK